MYHYIYFYDEKRIFQKNRIIYYYFSQILLTHLLQLHDRDLQKYITLVFSPKKII